MTICIPPTAVDYAVGWPLGAAWCKLVQFLIHATTYGSVYTLVLLSLDRYLAVVYPVRSLSLRTVPHTAVAIVATWAVVLAACAPLLFVFDAKEIAFAHGEVQKKPYLLLRTMLLKPRLTALHLNQWDLLYRYYCFCLHISSYEQSLKLAIAP